MPNPKPRLAAASRSAPPSDASDQALDHRAFLAALPAAVRTQLTATAVVFGLGIATVLTLVVTPALLALRVWITTYVGWAGMLLARITSGRTSRVARDMRLRRSARKLPTTELVWDDMPEHEFEDEGTHVSREEVLGVLARIGGTAPPADTEPEAEPDAEPETPPGSSKPIRAAE